MNQNYSNGAIPQPNPSYPMAGMQSSAYAPPLNYNQPTEVVGGYDALINPMTGQEIPQTNFARGGNVNSEAGLASLLASRGRNGDSMLVHMAPSEVKGLQSLAMAHGGSLTVNPHTGLVEANFLKSLLPTIIGAVLTPLTGGLINPMTAGLLVGGVEGLRTGDLGKGLMAGLGAYGGAGLGSALSTVGSTAGTAAKTALQTGVDTATQTATTFAPGATAPNIAGLTGSQAINAAGASGADAITKALAPEALKGVAAAPVNMANLGAGVSAIKAAPGAAFKAIGSRMGLAGIGGLGGSVASAMTPEYESPDLSKTLDRSYYESYGYSPEEGRFLGGEWRTGYPGFPGYAEGGDVDKDKPPAPTSSMSQYQSAPADAASFASYLQDLNKYVASPVAPPPRPAATTPPDTTTPFPRTGPGGRQDFGDFSDVDFSAINFGDFTSGGMNGLAGLINNFRGSDGRRQWDPDTGTFVEPGINVPPTTNVQPTITPDFDAGRFEDMVEQRGPLQTYRDMFNGPMADSYSEPTPAYTPTIDPYQQPMMSPAYSEPTPAYTSTIDPYQQPMMSPAYSEPTPAYTPFDYSGIDLGVEESPYQPQIIDENSAVGLPSMARRSKLNYAEGGSIQYAAAGKLLRGPGDGMSDGIKANISGKQEARLADGEFVIPADVVSHLGNGSSEAGSRRLYKMMADIRKARTGKSKQAPAVNVDRHLPKA